MWEVEAIRTLVPERAGAVGKRPSGCVTAVGVGPFDRTARAVGSGGAGIARLEAGGTDCLRTGRERGSNSGRSGAAVSVVPEPAGTFGTSPFNRSSTGIEGDVERAVELPLGFFLSTPKKIQPFQLVPVMAFAMTERER